MGAVGVPSLSSGFDTCLLCLVEERCTVSFIQRGCLNNNFHMRRSPRKSLGQHFLVDGAYLNRIMKAAQISSSDIILEVGPGRGSLTSRLVDTAHEVICIELDQDLAVTLPEKLGMPSNLTVVNADARQFKIDEIINSQKYKLVANLPYYAATPIIRKFLEDENPPQLLVVMVQREVARAMVAKPGNMSMLSVATQCYADSRLVCHVPAKAFRPPPSVVSSVVSLEPHSEPYVVREKRDTFFSIVRAGFSARRKQIKNSLSHGLGIDAGIVATALDKADIDGTRRAETLSLSEWVNLHLTMETKVE